MRREEEWGGKGMSSLKKKKEKENSLFLTETTFVSKLPLKLGVPTAWLGSKTDVPPSGRNFYRVHFWETCLWNTWDTGNNHGCKSQRVERRAPPACSSKQRTLVLNGKMLLQLDLGNQWWTSGHESRTPCNPSLSCVFVLATLNCIILWIKAAEILEIYQPYKK